MLAAAHQKLIFPTPDGKSNRMAAKTLMISHFISFVFAGLNNMSGSIFAYLKE